MTTDDYLKIMGYSKAEWSVLNEETTMLYSGMQGAVNNIYPISDKKFIKEIGKGYSLVNLAWMQRQAIEVPISEAPEKLKEAKEIIDNIIPSAVPEPPQISGIIIPKPPTEKEIEKLIEEEPQEPTPEDDFFCEQSCQTGDFCTKQCQDCNDREHGPGEEFEEQTIKEIIVEESGIPKDNIIIASVQEDVSWRKKRIKEVEDLGLTLIEDNYLSEDKTFGIPLMAIDKSSDKEWSERLFKLKKHIESLNAPEQMTLQRKCSLLEKNCGMIIEPTNLKAIHLNTGVFVSFSALENMDDNAFNEFVTVTIDTIDKKEKAIPQTPTPTKQSKYTQRVMRLDELGLEEEEFQFGNGTQAISKEWIKTLTDEDFDKEIERIQKSINLDEELDEMKKAKEIDTTVLTGENKKVKNQLPISKEMEEDANEAIEHIKEIVVADDKTINDFEFVDNIIATATLFKKSIYAITLIKNTLKCDDLTPAKKIALIEKHIQNVR